MPPRTRTVSFALLLVLFLTACRVGPTVSNHDQLEDIGSAEVYAINSGPAGESSVQVAFENTTDKALHITNMQWTILDGEGFTKATVRTESDLQIPARAKEKVVFTVAAPSSDIATVRLWDHDLDERPGARQAIQKVTQLDK